MPKPLKKPVRKSKIPAKPKRPTDVNRAVHAMMAEHMSRLEDAPSGGASATPLDFDAQYKAHMVKLGKRGGQVSGARRMQNLSAEQRREIASKAARAMWAKRRKAAK
jgi:hypothetical protein